jgi:hypothetical protein
MRKHVENVAPALRLALILLPLTGLAGCFFETREPEEGGGEVCYESVPSTDKLIVFNNLDGSMECLQASSYLDQLTPDFRFVPAPSVANQYPDVFPDEDAWGKGEEELFLNRLFADASAIESELLLEVIDESGTDPVEFEAKYQLRVVDRAGGAILYSGEAFFTVRSERTTWFLMRWVEKESAIGETPLGQLRGGLLQGG